MLSPVFGRYRIRLIQRQWRLGTESGSLEGNGDSVDLAGVPDQRPGLRYKLTRKWTTRKTRVVTRQENPGSARTRLIKARRRSDSEPPEDPEAASGIP